MNQWSSRGRLVMTERGAPALDPARRALDPDLQALFLKPQRPEPPPRYQPQTRFVPGLVVSELLGYRVVRS